MKGIGSLCLVLLWGGTALADERTDGGRVRKVTAIIGSSVSVERGELRLGKVVDLVINESGCIDFLVIDCDDGLIAVPWGVTTCSVERRVVVITHEITRERLKEVRFTRDRWPDFYEARFTQRLRTAWGEKALRPGGGKTGGEDRRPDRDKKSGGDSRQPDRDKDRKDATPKDRKDLPDKDRQTPPVTKDRDRVPPKDKVDPPKDRPTQDKDRPKDKPKDKP